MRLVLWWGVTYAFAGIFHYVIVEGLCAFAGISHYAIVEDYVPLLAFFTMLL